MTHRATSFAVVYRDETLASKQWFHRDYLGSTIAMTDTNGDIVTGSLHTYGPYGETINTGGNPYKYTGRYFDEETGLYYYRARYYSAELGRFLQTDPIGYGDDMKMYAYVGGDPINGTDPSGRWRTTKQLSKARAKIAAKAGQSKKQSGQSATGIGAVPGYPETGSNSWRASNDVVIKSAVASYNSINNLKKGDDLHMTPELMKTWAMVESGGDKKAFLSDPLQANNPGDHVAKKNQYGMTKGQTMTPQNSTEGALKWLHYKGSIHDNSGAVTGQRTMAHTLARYNGNTSPHSSGNGMSHQKWYARKILKTWLIMTANK